jgi:8-oxo-dGTP pyrophosphatase MutT (NUDIX family)
MSLIHNGPCVEGNSTSTVFWKYDTEGHLLCLIQKHPNRDFWEFTGGGVSHDEEYVPGDWDMFRQAAFRETLEELGMATVPKCYIWEASFQQRVKIAEGRFATGTLNLFSYQFDLHFTSNWSISDLVLQKEEVEDVQWIRVEDAILSTKEEPIDGVYLGRAYRIMATCFLSRHNHRRDHFNTQMIPWQGSLAVSITVTIGDRSVSI